MTWGGLSREQINPLSPVRKCSLYSKMQSPNPSSTWVVWANCPSRRLVGFYPSRLSLKRRHLFQEDFQVPKAWVRSPLLRSQDFCTRLYVQHHWYLNKCPYRTVWSSRPDTSYQSSLCPSCLSPGPGLERRGGWMSVEWMKDVPHECSQPVFLKQGSHKQLQRSSCSLMEFFTP